MNELTSRGLKYVEPDARNYPSGYVRTFIRYYRIRRLATVMRQV
jgi:hypothetical protein